MLFSRGSSRLSPVSVRCVRVLLLLATLGRSTEVSGFGDEPTVPGPLNSNAAVDWVLPDRGPVLVPDGRGTWIVAWYAWTTPGGPFGGDAEVLFSRSTDQGTTWTDPVPLNTNAATDAMWDIEPSLATDGHDTWIAAWRAGHSSGSDVLIARSTDNGATWSAPVVLDPGAGWHDREPRLACDGVGNWIIVWRSNRDGGFDDHDLYVAVSADDGETWSPASAIDAVEDGEDDEWHSVTADGAGRWFVLWRSLQDSPGQTPGSGLRQSRSTDNGASWSPPQVPPGILDNESRTAIEPRLATDGRGTLLAIWSTSGGTEIVATRSEDHGGAWSAPRLVAPSSNGYWNEEPTVSADGLGTWVALWRRRFISCDGCDDRWRLLASRSVDGGRSWGAAQEVASSPPGPSVSFGLDPSLASDGHGTWNAVWTSWADPDGTLGEDEDLFHTRWVFCEIRLDEDEMIRFHPALPDPEFELVTGDLDSLRDGTWPVDCVGTFDAGPGSDPSPPPRSGEGRFYLARGLDTCATLGWGGSSLDPDPRELLDLAPPCP